MNWSGAGGRLALAPGLSAGLILGACLVAYWLGPISTWDFNDDVSFSLLLSGELIASAPTPYLQFVNFALSSFLAVLYQRLPGIPWYGYFHVTALFGAVFFLNYCFALARSNDKFVLRLLASLLCTLPFLFLLQFTQTAAVLGCTGYLGLFLLSEVQALSPSRRWLLYTSAVIFLVASFALRQESFFLVTMLCGVLLLGKVRRENPVLLVSLGAVAVAIALLWGVHRYGYGEDWDGVHRLFVKLTHYADHYDYQQNLRVFGEAGWSFNDYLMLLNWGHIDGKVFSRESFEHVLGNATPQKRPSSVWDTLNVATAHTAANYLTVCAVLGALFLLLYRCDFRRLGLLVLAPCLLCLFWLVWNGRLPPRVSMSMAFVSLWLVLVRSGEIRKRLHGLLGGLLVAAALVLPVYLQYKQIVAVAAARDEGNRALRQLGKWPAGKDTVLVVFGGAFPFESLLPFDSLDYLENFKMVVLGSLNQSPLQRKWLEELGTRDLFRSLLTEENYYVSIPMQQREVLERYFFEHYRQTVRLKPAYFDKRIVLYRILEQDAFPGHQDRH